MKARILVSVGALASIVCAQSPRIGEWKLDEASGFVAADSSANGNHGTLLGFTNDPAQWVPGRFGNALAFDGVDDRIDIAFAPGGGLPFFTGRGEAFSLCMWVRGAPADDDRVLALSNTAATAPLFTLGTGNLAAGAADKLKLMVRNDQGIASERVSTRVVFDGTWHHVAYVESSGVARLYVDGSVDPAVFDDRFGTRGTRTATYGTYDFDKLALGAIAQATPSRHWAGTLDEVSAYRYALTADDVLAIVAGGQADTCRASLGEFGVGCGPGPFELWATGSSVIGSTGLSFSMRGGRPGAIAFLGLGIGLIQSVDLGGAGLAGCSVYAPNPIFWPVNVLDASGSLTTLPFAVPNQPSLAYTSVVFQSADLGVTGIDFSNAVVAVLGLRSPHQISETFTDETNLDRDVSSGAWRQGLAFPGRLGGLGIHGSFRPQIGTLLPGTTDTYLIDTGNVTIPRAWTLFGEQAITITDGHFEFTDFVVPAGIKVIFVGAHPAVIRVRGLCRVDGEVGADGATPLSNFPGHSRGPGHSILGQIGAPGGAGGGAGGQGADGCLGNGAQPGNTGRPGQDCRAPAASAYAGQVAGTGGPGSPLFPVSGQSAMVSFTYFNAICAQTTSGGSGGSFLGLGEVGHVVQTLATLVPWPADAGQDSVPGNLIPITTRPAGVTSLDHFLVAGAGGGGSGSQPMNMLTVDINSGRAWTAGGAGAGGGGAIAFRVGHEFAVATGATVSARGGGGATSTNGVVAPPVPGGGGSGGSVIVQVESQSHLLQAGTIDVRGGPRGVMNVQRIASTAIAYGGAGGHGAVRFESDGPISAAALGTVLGPPSIPGLFFGTLDPTDSDAKTACTSRWRTTRLTTLPVPVWTHYRIAARVRSVPVVYTDDPANYNPADSDSLPIRIWFQGGAVDGNGQLFGTPGPWRSYVNGLGGRSSINLDHATGMRFMVVFNRDVETDVVIEDIDVMFIS